MARKRTYKQKRTRTRKHTRPQDSSRFFSAILIFLMFLAGVLYIVRFGTDIVSSDTLQRSSGNTIVDLGYDSQWFKGERYGKQCSAWITCKSDGAVIHDIVISQGTDSLYMSDEHPEIQGMIFETCNGADEGISISGIPYSEADNDHIIVTVKTGDHHYGRTFNLDVPESFSLISDGLFLSLIYEAELSGTWQMYQQKTFAQACGR